MFETPEHASYVALMRALRLERKAELLDIFVNYWPDGHEVEFVRDRMQARLVRLPDGDNQGGSIWLPRLDQWLSMLEEAGATRLYWEKLSSNGWHRVYLNATIAYELPDADLMTGAPTREEAAARLWMAVTGREAP